MRRHPHSRARRTVVDGRTHGSVGEAGRFAALGLLEKAHAITDLVPHPRFFLLPTFAYKADAAYLERGRLVVEDYKGGYIDQRWRDVKNVWKSVGPAVLRVVTAGGKLVEEIPPGDYVVVRRSEYDAFLAWRKRGAA